MSKTHLSSSAQLVTEWRTSDYFHPSQKVTSSCPFNKPFKRHPSTPISFLYPTINPSLIADR